MARRQDHRTALSGGGLVEHLPEQILDVVVGRGDRAAVGEPPAVLRGFVVVHQPGRQGQPAVLQNHLHVASPTRRHRRPQPNVDEISAGATRPRVQVRDRTQKRIQDDCRRDDFGVLYGVGSRVGPVAQIQPRLPQRRCDRSGHVHPPTEQGVAVDIVHTATAGRRRRCAPEAPMLPLRDRQVVGPGCGCADAVVDGVAVTVQCAQCRCHRMQLRAVAPKHRNDRMLVDPSVGQRLDDRMRDHRMRGNLQKQPMAVLGGGRHRLCEAHSITQIGHPVVLIARRSRSAGRPMPLYTTESLRDEAVVAHR